MKLRDQFKDLQAKKRALLATNYYNLETLLGVVNAAKVSECSLILQLTESSINYMGLENALAMGRSALKTSGVQGWIHLDHGGSVELAERCLEAGFDSVMFDGSELPIEKNIELTRKVVTLAKKTGANVEAELGYVAKLGQSSDKVEYTDPADARRFVEETGVDCLAVAIGSAHGFYKSTPKLDFDRLDEIRKATPAYLVLHGASGIPDDQLRRAVSLGICKINLATEIKDIFMRTLKEQLASSSEIDLRKVFPPATQAVTRLVSGKLNVINS